MIFLSDSFPSRLLQYFYFHVVTLSRVFFPVVCYEISVVEVFCSILEEEKIVLFRSSI